MGVFATRSPFRPNPLGLTSVRLLRVEDGDLIVSGADLLDGTPIYDIKPYLSFSDCHEEAKNGFAEETADYRLKVVWDVKPSSESIYLGLTYDLPSTYQAHWKDDLEYILSQDPRPGYQDDPEREYKLDYAGRTVTFVVHNNTVIVKNIQKMQKDLRM
jgi:hypothetical protein